MTRERAVEVLKSLRESTDTESAHETADDILCRLLTALGYADVVEEWDKVKKWYA